MAAQTAAAAPAAAIPGEAYVDLPNSQIRKVTAARMVSNKNDLPHYYVMTDVVMDELMAMRAKVNAAQDVKTSVNDYVIKACALACAEVPACNSTWTADYIREYSNVDISVAVNTDKGLLTPIVFGAESKSVTAISADVKALAGKAKEGKLKPEEFIGGTFTVSNLGSFGVKQFTAIINAPQACILAVGGAEKKVVPNDGADAASNPFVVKSVMTVSLSSDHRVVDGAIAAQWLSSFKKHMENPLLLLL
jgi:pyruvate dehydrogenase E2 component (dihydrolipoamide acetyltransferase)